MNRFTETEESPLTADAEGGIMTVDPETEAQQRAAVEAWRASRDQAAAEIVRVLRPGGTALIAVPCDMRLWSAHDVAVHHVRRYDRDGLLTLLEKAGLVVDTVGSWNVLLRPVAAWRRRSSSGSDLTELPTVVNLALTGIIAAERYLPVGSLPGVSLLVRAHRPA